jgi:Domain of unknown function (DUF4149)
MAFLRFVGLVALALWMGGLATLGALIAPTLFDVLGAHDPTSGRELAGTVFGSLFERLQRASWIAGTILLLSLAGRAALGPRPRWFGIRMWIAAGMLAASVSSVLFVTPRIERLRPGASHSMASVPADDQLRAEFRRWHMVSTALLMLTLAAGVGLLWMEATDRH